MSFRISPSAAKEIIDRIGNQQRVATLLGKTKAAVSRYYKGKTLMPYSDYCWLLICLNQPAVGRSVGQIAATAIHEPENSIQGP